MRKKHEHNLQLAKRADAAARAREIDERVYRLCGLTAAEIKVVEGARKG